MQTFAWVIFEWQPLQGDQWILPVSPIDLNLV
jgi:hypothetical protein